MMSPSQIALPYDLLANVAVYAERDALRQMCLVSHELHDCAVRELYRQLRMDTAQTVRCFETLRDSPTLSLHVRSLYYSPYSAPFFMTPAELGPFASLLAPAIRSMTGLKQLDLKGIADIIQLIVNKTQDDGSLFEDILDSIAGLPQVNDIDLACYRPLAPLLQRLKPLKRLVFFGVSADSGLALEQILRASTDTLEELHLHDFEIASLLKKEPRLVSPRVTRLSLHLCGLLGMELPCAFPHVKRFLFFPPHIELLSLITDPANFPELEYLELWVDKDFKRSVTDVQRTVANLSIFDGPSDGTPLAPALMNFLGVFHKDALRSLQLPSLSKEDAPTTTLREILGLFPNLEFFSANLPEVENPWIVANQTFWSLRAPNLRGISLGFKENHIAMLARVVELEMNDLREGLPALTFLELHSAFSPSRTSAEPMAQFRRDKGMAVLEATDSFVRLADWLSITLLVDSDASALVPTEGLEELYLL